VATQANVARLLDTPGFKVIDCKTEGDLLWVELRGHKRRRPVCSGCGQPAPPSAIHDRKLRTVRDLALGRIPTVTLGRYRRYREVAIAEWLEELEAPAGVRSLARGNGIGE
jgi:transposase